MKSIRLADGRTLAYEDVGAPDGLPVVFSHGFMDSRLIRNPDDELTASLGVRLIVPDQPGVGGSTPQPRRRLIDWGHDVEQLADALGLGTFASAGHSAGGPHALAVATYLPSRVSRGALLAAVAPLDMPGFADMLATGGLRALLPLRRARPLVRAGTSAAALIARRRPRQFVEMLARSSPGGNATYLRDPAQRAMFEASFEAGSAQGGEPLMDILEAIFDWGFTLADVSQHVDVFFCGADEVLKPEMGHAIAAGLPCATANFWPGAEHYGFIDHDHWTEFLTTLVEC